MKIKIVRASKASYWYANSIGKVFTVTGKNIDDLYYVQHNGQDKRFLVDENDFRIEKPNRPFLCCNAQNRTCKYRVSGGLYAGCSRGKVDNHDA